VGAAAGVYRSCDPTIAAVGPGHYDIACGTALRVCDVSGVRCLTVYRVDSCPGCSSQPLGEYIDLSEAALDYLAGDEGASVVKVTVEVLHGKVDDQ
jgi:hypothetical protein